MVSGQQPTKDRDSLPNRVGPSESVPARTVCSLGSLCSSGKAARLYVREASDTASGSVLYQLMSIFFLGSVQKRHNVARGNATQARSHQGHDRMEGF